MSAAIGGLLLVPVTSGKGIGEYSRCLMLAKEMRARFPNLPIQFVVAKGSLFVESCPFETLLIEGSPVNNSKLICDVIGSTRPQAVVFDSTGRTEQLRAAKAVGAFTVFVSSRANKRKKGMRLHWLRLLDAHWHVQPRWVDGELSRIEQLKLRLARRCAFRFLDSFFPPPSAIAVQNAHAAVGLEPDEAFVLFASGGGGRRKNRPHAPDVFLAAAQQLSLNVAQRCVVVMGPAADELTAEQRQSLGSVRVEGSLPSDQFIGLLSEAQTVVIGGGSTIGQALALQRCCVAAPAGSDQPHRIERTRLAGLLLDSPTEVQPLADSAFRAVTDESLRSELQQAIARQKPRNGLPIAVDLLSAALEVSSPE